MASEPVPHLTDLVPKEALERQLQLFEALTGIPMVIVDATGVPVTPLTDPLRFCGTLVRDPEGRTVCLRRQKWDVPEEQLEREILGQHGGNKPVAHRCLGGFRDTAVPILVEEQVVGYAVFARSLTDRADLQAFRGMATAAGMEPEIGEQVARKALVMPSERIRDVAEYVALMSGLVAAAAHTELKARKVLQLEKLRDDLTHMIVHDLRTPLTSVIGGLQTILDTEFDEEITKEFVPLALSSSNTLLEMVNTLLDISKFEGGEMTLNRTPVDFGEVARVALEQVEGLARTRNQELLSDLAPNCGEVSADRELLRRVVVNLLGNAIKFTQDGGTIRLGSHCDPEGLTFSVADNGPGIPAEFHQRIFEKFGQVESRKAGRKNSTGLGLTLCKMVAEAHGGRIWLESEVGKGTTFFVWIPRAGSASD